MIENTNNSEISEAIEHLNEVLRHSEESVMSILDSARKIEENNSKPAAISEYVTSIYDACTFQDIAAQRIRKVVGQLTELQKNGISGGKTKTKKSSNDLLEGPQLPKNKPTQGMIDKTFSE
jgi:hypothetical protein